MKEKGYDFLIYLITFIVVIMSYQLTVESIEDIEETQEIINNFMRTSFVFLAPCALETLTLFVSNAERKPKVDRFEVIIGIFSIIMTGYLWYGVANNIYLLKTVAIKVLLLVYPIKVGVILFSILIELLEERSRT